MEQMTHPVRRPADTPLKRGLFGGLLQREYPIAPGAIYWNQGIFPKIIGNQTKPATVKVENSRYFNGSISKSFKMLFLKKDTPLPQILSVKILKFTHA